jgi:ATP-binding cassette subfamily F protein uup
MRAGVRAEESLLEFRGSLVLVTHDRYMLDRVSNVVLGLDGKGSAESFAHYAQWEQWQQTQPKRGIESQPRDVWGRVWVRCS